MRFYSDLTRLFRIPCYFEMKPFAFDLLTIFQIRGLVSKESVVLRNKNLDLSTEFIR